MIYVASGDQPRRVGDHVSESCVATHGSPTGLAPSVASSLHALRFSTDSSPSQPGKVGSAPNALTPSVRSRGSQDIRITLAVLRQCHRVEYASTLNE